MEFTSMPKLEIKNLRTFKSIEWHGYEATLYVDGKRFAEASNDGVGACDHFHPLAPFTYHDVEALAKFIKEKTPKIKTEYGEISNHIDIVVGDLIEDILKGRDLKRLLKSSMVYQKDGKLFSLKLRGVKSLTKEHIAKIEKARPDHEFLNSMKFDDAFKIYKECA